MSIRTDIEESAKVAVISEMSVPERRKWNARARRAHEQDSFGDALGDWLATFDWDLWFTGTFAGNVESLTFANEMWNRFVKALNCRVYGPLPPVPQVRRERVSIYYVWERQQRGAWHVHALILAKVRAGSAPVPFTDIHGMWKTAGGGRAWVQVYVSEDAARYATKVQKTADGTAVRYAVKDVQGQTWGICGSAARMRLARREGDLSAF